MKPDKKIETMYFNDIKKYPLLSPAEERKLLRQIKENVPGAVDKLVKSNLKFVIQVARHHIGKGLELSDLINEGNRGLIIAAQKFNLKKRVRFISYAVWWIRQSIQRAIFSTSKNIRLPTNKLMLLRQFKKVLEISGDYNLALSGFPDKENDVVKAFETKTISLETPVGSEPGTTMTLKDMLSVSAHQDQEIHDKELMKLFDDALQKVPVREERIIRMYFGLNMTRNFTLEEIGNELGLTRERVRMLRDKTLRRLIHNQALRTFKDEQ
jgi:RNA polymerase primary sigma factor